LASSAPLHVPQKWRRPVRQRSRLVRRTGPAHARVEFAHPSEQEFARFLDYYRIRWVYEPVSFPIAWDGERIAEMFTPDFYLPEHDLYVEVTTMKQSLVTPKNRKVRMLRELYPDVSVRLLYRKDYQQLLAKAGYGAVEVQNLRKQDIGDIVISPVELETRVRALATKISRDYRGRSIVLVGVLKGITFFMADLARQKNTHPVELMIDMALERDMKFFMVQPIANENQTEALELMKHPRSVVTFSDSGAHVSQIMDSSLQTHLLSHWVRDKQAFASGLDRMLTQAIRKR